ncbi:MAG: DUF3467 domain-containing protein [Calditrichaeota bacterium]|nr:MAG: DUF3467 domain-containing protein [Calditrichota bacterium]
MNNPVGGAPAQQINIELPPEQAEGIYSNLAIITHSASEFVLDFTRVMPGVPKARVYARIIMTPQHAKSLLKALEENIKRYENQFGEIKIHDKGATPRSFGFLPPQPPAPESPQSK